MGNKVYLMIKIAEEASQDGYLEALKGLEAMPEVKSIELVSGDYDLVAGVDVPKSIIPVADRILENGWVKRVEVIRVEPLEPNPFVDELCSIPGGEGVLWCAQCGMCSASCPNVDQMDCSPRKIIALIRAGKRHKVLTSNSMGVCASCYLCTVRCPRGVRITELMHALECLAVRRDLTSAKTSTPTMHRLFVNTVRRNGRIHELGLMVRFYLRTNPFLALKLIPVGLRLLLRGRMPLRARKIKGTEQLKAIIEEVQALGGAL